MRGDTYTFTSRIMEFDEKKPEEKERYAKDVIDLAYKFSGQLMKEFGTFVKAISIFGSAARGKKTVHDIDILVVVDDTTIVISAEIAEAYRVIVEKTIADISTRLHVTTLRLTTFWEYLRAGDPIGMNIVRDLYIIMDSGFFRPIQALLVQGRLRPSPEAVWNYFSRANRSLTNSRWNLLRRSA